MAGDKRLATVTTIKTKMANGSVPDPTYLNDWQELEGFCTSEAAKAVLRYLAPKLREERMLTVLDGLTLVRVAEDYAECWLAQKQVSEMLSANKMPIVKGKGGGFNYHPSVVIRNRAADRFERGVMHMGLSPASRAKLRTPNGQSDLFGADPLAELMQQVHGNGRGLPANSRA